MPSGLAVESLEARAPARGARRAAATALREAGTARDTLLLVVDRGEHPGVAVAPWIVDGVLEHARDRGLRLAFERIGNASRNDPVARTLLAAAIPPAAPRPGLKLQIPGARRTLSIPGAWVGAHACLLSPCLRERTADGAVTGPVANALDAIARACGADPTRPITDVGAWLLGRAFASVGIILDATWTALLDEQGAHLQSSAHCMAWSAPRAELDATALDKAIAAALSFPRGCGNTGARLAERKVGGLWRKRPMSPRVPGPLARAWYAYPENGP